MVMDANLPSKEVYAILQSFRNIHNHDNDNDNSNEEWGLLIYGKLIHLYQIAVRGIASADVYSPLMDPEDCGVDIERGYFGDHIHILDISDLMHSITSSYNKQLYDLRQLSINTAIIHS